MLEDYCFTGLFVIFSSRSVPPQSLQAIEFASLFCKYVYYNIYVIQQYPRGPSSAFPVPQFCAIFIKFFRDDISDSLYVRVRIPAAYNEKVSHRG